MKFALNYSPEASDLLREGKIQLDLFKCPDWQDMIAEAREQLPVYVHFPLIAGSGNFEDVGLDRIAEFMAQTGTPYVNTHLAPTYEALPPYPTPESVVKRVMQDVMPLVERFGAENVMIENIPMPERRQRDKPMEIVLPEVITRVVEECGIGFLLDLGHARRTAEHLAIDPRTYIAALPTHRLQELHVTGLGYNATGFRTDHLPMREDDWELFAWALDHIKNRAWREPWAVACEYGGIGEPFRWRSERTVIEEQIPRMWQMVQSAQPVGVR